MKTIPALLFAFTLFFSGFTAQAQKGGNTETVKIKTSSVCNMCKKTIEKAMAYEKGVKSAILDVDSQILTVAFFPEKTSADKVRKAVTATGYDADQLAAQPKAYDKLDDCCKKDKGVHKD